MEKEKDNNIFNLHGPLWRLMSELKPEDYLEPLLPINFGETVLGPMSEAAKAAFTVQEQLLGALLILVDLQDASEEEIIEFDTWLIDNSREQCALRYKDSGEDNVIAILQIRNQYFSACNFLDLVTSQEYNIDLDDSYIFYREGFKVVVTSNKMVDGPDYN